MHEVNVMFPNYFRKSIVGLLARKLLQIYKILLLNWINTSLIKLIQRTYIYFSLTHFFKFLDGNCFIHPSMCNSSWVYVILTPKWVTELVDIPSGSDATNLPEPGCCQSPLPLFMPLCTTALVYGSPFMNCCFGRCDLFKQSVGRWGSDPH